VLLTDPEILAVLEDRWFLVPLLHPVDLEIQEIPKICHKYNYVNVEAKEMK
jgi:hypothetical protein